MPRTEQTEVFDPVGEKLALDEPGGFAYNKERYAAQYVCTISQRGT